MSIKLAKKTETVYVARCQWVVGKDAEGKDITGFGLLWERKSYAEAADIVDRHAAMQYGNEGRFYHTWLEQITRYDDGSEESVIVREHNRPQAADAIDTSAVTAAQEIGRNHGYNHANYVDAYGGDMDEEPSVPPRFAGVETYYTAAYAEGVERYRQERYDD